MQKRDAPRTLEDALYRSYYAFVVDDTLLQYAFRSFQESCQLCQKAENKV